MLRSINKGRLLLGGASARRRASSLPAALSEIGSHRFDDRKMRQYLAPDVYERFTDATWHGKDLSSGDKDAVAKAMFAWATSLGAVNYAHHFSPMRASGLGLGGTSAYKHDAFVSLDFAASTAIKPIVTTFSGTQLFVGETDGSSFPNGGLRQTHRAAGFTSWDRSSPPWVYGDTLFIPCAFVSHFGAALDHKTPLLRSQAAINEYGVRLLRALGDKDVQKVVSNVGWEQEFFVVDRDMYLERPDLVNCGRTLVGSLPPRHQQTEFNYYGLMPPRVKAYLTALQTEMLRLGIAMSTYHNEVSPGQHEISPIFSLTNVATDQNSIAMEVIHEVSVAHGLVVLFHEKPFAGINGSGKHNNWGLNTDTGANLFVPGKTVEAQQRFMACVAALAHALCEHSDLVRCGVATAGNDHRLGAQEAPPAIISLYTGHIMEEHIKKIIDGGPLEGYGMRTATVHTGAATVCPIPVNLEDRNRTAPFPFCGNRFEFRAVGSSQNIALPLAMVNAAMADGMRALAEKIEGGKSVRDAVADTFRESHRIIFNGNGYSREWREEAARRGVLNLKNTVEAIEQFATDKNVALLERLNIFTPEETRSRQDVMFENYYKVIELEASTLVRMMRTQMLPALANQISEYKGSIDKLEERISAATVELEQRVQELEKRIEKLPATEAHEIAQYCLDQLIPQMLAVREVCDNLEQHISPEWYPFPNYEELLYSHHVEAPRS